MFLRKFDEKEIEFAPTYKYKKNSDEYTEKNKARPAYCDRILIQEDPLYKLNLLERIKAKPEQYFRKESQFSDHRPIIAVFNPQVITIDRKKREQ